MAKKVASRFVDILVSKAKRESGEIFLPSHINTIEECITKVENKLMFWYNDIQGNTKAVVLTVK